MPINAGESKNKEPPFINHVIIKSKIKLAV
jgi:hypothetical protein